MLDRIKDIITNHLWVDPSENLKRSFAEIEEDISWIEDTGLAPLSSEWYISKDDWKEDLTIKATVQIWTTKYAESYIQTSVSEFDWEAKLYAEYLCNLIAEWKIFKDKFLSEKEIRKWLPDILTVKFCSQTEEELKLNIEFRKWYIYCSYSEKFVFSSTSLFEALRWLKKLIKDYIEYNPFEDSYEVRFDTEWNPVKNMKVVLDSAINEENPIKSE